MGGAEDLTREVAVEASDLLAQVTGDLNTAVAAIKE